jgi:hypothetical protein
MESESDVDEFLSNVVGVFSEIFGSNSDARKKLSVLINKKNKKQN